MKMKHYAKPLKRVKLMVLWASEAEKTAKSEANTPYSHDGKLTVEQSETHHQTPTHSYEQLRYFLQAEPVSRHRQDLDRQEWLKAKRCCREEQQRKRDSGKSKAGRGCTKS